MNRYFLLLLLAITSIAQGDVSSPLIWNGANARDLTTGGVMTPKLVLPEGGVVTGTDKITFVSPSLSASYTLTFPTDDGTLSQFLQTDGSGGLSWATSLDASSLGSKPPAALLCETNIAALTGVKTCDTVSTTNGIIVLLTGQTNQTENGLWVTAAGAWARYSGFTSATVPGSVISITEAGGGGAFPDTLWLGTGDASSGNNGYRNVPTTASASLLGASSVVLTTAGKLLTSSTTLGISNGGSNKALTLAAGGLLWTDADSFEVSAAGTASNWALSGGSGAPTFSNITTTAKTIDGSADAIQLTVQGHSTQTSDIFVAEKSDGTDLLEVTNTAGTLIRGTTTNDAAATGFVGQYVESISSNVSVPELTTLWGDITSISLTAGDWDVVAAIVAIANGATVTSWTIGISTTSGNSSTGLVDGSNYLVVANPSAAGNTSMAIPSYRMSLSGTTTVYYKVNVAYSVATPKIYSRISARRVR